MENLSGWKAVWLSEIDNYEDLDDYTEDTWDSSGERSLSQFATDFGITWYDPDSREFDIETDAESFKDLFSGVSYEENYIDDVIRDLSEFDCKKYKSFMILHDFKYEGEGSSKKAVFIGNYRYK